MSRLVCDSVPACLHHRLSAAPDCLSSVTDFPIAAARVWNSLSEHLTSAPSMAVFRSRLKIRLCLYRIAATLCVCIRCLRSDVRCFGHYNRLCLLAYFKFDSPLTTTSPNQSEFKEWNDKSIDMIRRVYIYLVCTDVAWCKRTSSCQANASREMRHGSLQQIQTTRLHRQTSHCVQVTLPYPLHYMGAEATMMGSMFISRRVRMAKTISAISPSHNFKAVSSRSGLSTDYG